MGSILGGGSGTTTTSSSPRPLSEEEKRLVDLQADFQELVNQFLPTEQGAVEQSFEFSDVQRIVQQRRFDEEAQIRGDTRPVSADIESPDEVRIAEEIAALEEQRSNIELSAGADEGDGTPAGFNAQLEIARDRFLAVTKPDNSGQPPEDNTSRLEAEKQLRIIESISGQKLDPDLRRRQGVAGPGVRGFVQNAAPASVADTTSSGGAGAETDLSIAEIDEKIELLRQQQEDARTARESLTFEEAGIGKKKSFTEIFDEIEGEIPDQEELDTFVDDLTAGQFELGKTRLLETQQDLFEQLNQEFAPSRGLRGGNFRTGAAADTPIIDRGGLIARETTRQTGQLASSLANAANQFKIDLRNLNLSNRIALGSLRTGRRLESIGGNPAIQSSGQPVIQSSGQAGGSALSALLNRQTNTTTTSPQPSKFAELLAASGTLLTGIGKI